MITAQQADVFKNRTFAVRLISLVLFFIGTLIFSSFIAILTSSLTLTAIKQLDFHDIDLRSQRIGVIRSSHSQDYCKLEFLACDPFDSLPQAVAALKTGQLDAVIAQKVELNAETAQLNLPLMYADIPNTKSYYAFFFRDGFEGMADFNQALIEVIEQTRYRELIRRYTGLGD